MCVEELLQLEQAMVLLKKVVQPKPASLQKFIDGGEKQKKKRKAKTAKVPETDNGNPATDFGAFCEKIRANFVQFVRAVASSLLCVLWSD